MSIFYIIFGHQYRHNLVMVKNYQNKVRRISKIKAQLLTYYLNFQKRPLYYLTERCTVFAFYFLGALNENIFVSIYNCAMHVCIYIGMYHYLGRVCELERCNFWGVYILLVNSYVWARSKSAGGDSGLLEFFTVKSQF